MAVIKKKTSFWGSFITSTKEPQGKTVTLPSLKIALSEPKAYSWLVDVHNYVDGIPKNKSPWQSQNSPYCWVRLFEDGANLSLWATKETKLAVHSTSGITDRCDNKFLYSCKPVLVKASVTKYFNW